MKKLAIFDVDYTITSKETLMELYKYSIKEDKRNIKYIPRAIFSGAMYICGFYNEKQVKECFLKFLENRTEEEINNLAERFYDNRIVQILYSNALEMMRKLKKEGYDVYLISASPEFYIKKFYKINEVDKIIGTKFLFENGKFTRRMDGENCKGEEKVIRLKNELEKQRIDVNFNESYMFSDSLSDKPLLDLVGKPYLINYKKKHEIKILKWK
ncbi:MAG: HAD-IB family hydrolase [Clostridiaceae bacterium]|nr:HAD-IB family hydrolase [Clostridiaceae bacterium]